MRNSSYSLMQNVLKLYRCFGHSLNMCMCLDIILRLFLLPFLQVELHFSCVITLKDKLQMAGDINSLNLSFVLFFLRFIMLQFLSVTLV